MPNAMIGFRQESNWATGKLPVVTGSYVSLVVNDSACSSESQKVGWLCQTGAISKSEAYERQAGTAKPPLLKHGSAHGVRQHYLLPALPNFRKSPSLPSDSRPL